MAENDKTTVEWLPKDERKLLRFYYNQLDGKCFKSLPLMDDVNIASMEAMGIISVKQYPNDHTHITCAPEYPRFYDARLKLQGRNLIKTHDYSEDEEIDVESIPPELRSECLVLTLQGSDLAKKYSHWFSRWGLWWGEHKGNPIWIIIGFIITYILGIGSALLIEKLK